MADNRSIKSRVEALEAAMVPAFARLAAVELFARRWILHGVDAAVRGSPGLTRLQALRGLRTGALASVRAEFAALNPAFGPAELAAAESCWLNLLDDCERLLLQADAAGRPEE